MSTRSFVPLLVILLPCTTFAASSGLSLKDAFRAALERNEAVRQSSERIVQANARISGLRGSLFPELSINAVHVVQSRPDDPIAQEFSPPNQTTANLRVNQPLFHGLREFAGLRQQKLLRSAQEAGKREAIQLLYQEVATRYLDVLTLEQDLKNLTDQVEIYNRRVVELRRRTRRGESSTTELLSTQSTQNSLKAEVQLTEGRLKVAQENLHSLTGKPRESKLVDPELLAKMEKAPEIAPYLARAESRPDVQTALLQRDAADAGISIARGAHYPSIDAVGNYYFKRPGFLEDIKWDVSIQLGLPIFSGGSIQAQVREASSVLREAEIGLARARRLASQEIHSLHQSLSARFEQLALLRKSVELAEKNVSVSQNEFRRGLIRSIDVQLALGEFRAVRRSLDQAYFAAQMDLLRLEVASGMRPQGIAQP